MKFTAEDFQKLIIEELFFDGMARLANEKLEEWLKDAPTVFGAGVLPPGCDYELSDYHTWSQLKIDTDTFEAKLVCIKEISNGRLTT